MVLKPCSLGEIRALCIDNQVPKLCPNLWITNAEKGPSSVSLARHVVHSSDAENPLSSANSDRPFWVILCYFLAQESKLHSLHIDDLPVCPTICTNRCDRWSAPAFDCQPEIGRKSRVSHMEPWNEELGENLHIKFAVLGNHGERRTLDRQHYWPWLL